MSLVIIIFLFLFPCLFLHLALKKNITYPATVFSFVFFIVLTMAYFSHYLFGYYTISLETYAIYGLGNISFIIGSLFLTALKTEKTKPLKHDERKISAKLNFFFYFLLLFCLLYTPVIYTEFINVTPNESFSVRILRLREYALNEQVYSTLTNNLILLSTFLAMLGAYLYSFGKIKIYLFLLAYIVFAYYNFLTGTRSAIILVTAAIFFIYLVNTKKKSKLFLTSMFASAFLLGAVVAIFMGKDGMDREAGFSDNLNKVVDNYFSYTVQGVILFDNYVTKRDVISENWDILSGTKEVINKVSGENTFKLSSKFSDFSNFSDNKDGNVYTIYFSVYPHYGLFGVVFFFVLYGLMSSTLYHSAESVFNILLCYVNATLCLNIFNEQVFTNLIFTIKLVTFISICRYVEKLR